MGGKGSQQGKEGKDLNRERGENIVGRKREKLRGRKGLRGERGNGSQQGKVATGS